MKINIKKLLSQLFFAVFLFTLISPTVFAQSTTDVFSDVTRVHPYYTALIYMSDSDVVQGYDDGTFKPENPINRAEVLKIILGGSNIESDEPFEAFFPDVTADQWFAPYVIKAKVMGFVKGNDADGTFTPARQVNLAEFLKMLLFANNIDVTDFKDELIANISYDDWFAPYINYAAALGIVTKDVNGNVDAAKYLTRGEVMSMMYLLNIIRNGQDTQFLLDRAEAELAQIEVYIAANQVGLAKGASELAVDITQQAYANMSTNDVVLGAAKIARAYDWLVDAFIYGIQANNAEAARLANDAIDKATEAWEANNATQPIAKHIKDRAREILAQVGGVEE